MSQPQEATPALYREAAGRLKELAKETPLPEIRAELLSVAEYFERIATHLQTQSDLRTARR